MLQYRILSLDLGMARTNQLFEVQGEVIVYVDPTNGGPLSVRLNNADADQINMLPKTRIVFPFERVYITNAAQAGLSANLFISANGKALVTVDG